MRRRHPELWLMTDERMGDAARAVARLPQGSAVVFRHYRTPPAERRRLFAALLAIARRRRLVLLRAGTVAFPGEMGVHGAGRARQPGLRSFAAHDRREAIAAVRAGADVLLVSPVFATRSHPGARPLGAVRASTIARGLGVPAIALGGMTARRYRTIKRHGFAGWAAIDALAPDQKRKAVPT